MMMVQAKTALDEILVVAVNEILLAYGKDAVVVSGSKDTRWDPVSFTTLGSTISRAVKVTPPAPYKKRFSSLDAVEVGDMQCFVNGADVDIAVWEPKQGEILRVPIETDTLTIRVDTWRITAVGPVFSGARIVLWELMLERVGSIPRVVATPSPVSVVVSARSVVLV